jgi:hypothetical protein
MAMKALTYDEKELRKALIDDFCARNRVECLPAVPVFLTPDELAALALERGSWIGRGSSIRTDKRPQRQQ